MGILIKFLGNTNNHPPPSLKIRWNVADLLCWDIEIYSDTTYFWESTLQTKLVTIESRGRHLLSILGKLWDSWENTKYIKLRLVGTHPMENILIWIKGRRYAVRSTAGWSVRSKCGGLNSRGGIPLCRPFSEDGLILN